MGRKLNRFSLWLRRQSHLSVIIVAGAFIVLLFSNEETSMARSQELDKEIASLEARIKQAEDSAAYYRHAREDLITGTEELEKVSRENYGMQRPTEDVYIVE
ncbi:MAG: septum formation initiator family protein [Muribaculaceae bacterium]|nr:septum formation initiator family protein [Muribaculaceae bacterium]